MNFLVEENSKKNSSLNKCCAFNWTAFLSTFVSPIYYLFSLLVFPLSLTFRFELKNFYSQGCNWFPDISVISIAFEICKHSQVPSKTSSVDVTYNCFCWRHLLQKLSMNETQTIASAWSVKSSQQFWYHKMHGTWQNRAAWWIDFINLSYKSMVTSIFVENLSRNWNRFWNHISLIFLLYIELGS